MSARSVWMPTGGEERLVAVVAHAREHSSLHAGRLAAGWQAAPLMRKEHLGPLQAEGRPFGGLLGEPVSALARIFLSPGEIYDPQGARPDYWRFGTALAAAGFRAGDVVLNCFNYHLSPAGFMFDEGARSLGCVVIPAGVGQQEMQVKVAQETGAAGFVGLPSYLLALLQRGARFERAFVSAEPLPPSLRDSLGAYGVDVYQGYGTADLGLVAYECPHREGMHLDDGVVVEICDPDGQPVPMGEVGEVVVTLLSTTYLLIRFGTGDLSALIAEPCPCGRPSLRMRGWLGRVGEAVKVRGMFVYPRQLEEALARFGPEAARWQAVVERGAGHRDRLVVTVDGPVDAAAVAEAVRLATRVAPEVVLGPVAAEARRFEDRRVWE